jgi:hypothetical protein
MHPEDSHKLTFTKPHVNYEFEGIPFGLKNAPETYQQLMDRTLIGLQGNEVFVYLDDIFIYSSSVRGHEIKFREITNRLRAENLKLELDKCEFLRKEVCYIGHMVSADSVRPDPKKLETLQGF